jgi:TonB family protein
MCKIIAGILCLWSAWVMAEGVNDTTIEMEIVSENNVNQTILTESLPPIEKMPELKTFVTAEYPSHLIKQGCQGTVLLELLVSEIGSVDSVALSKGINKELDLHAANAAKKFKFSPAVAGGKPVAVLIQYEYRFSLDQLIDSIAKVINFQGELVEKGTRTPIADAMVVITFTDTVSDSTLPLPFSMYLEKIGKIEGQALEEKKIVVTTDSLGKFTLFSLPSVPVELSVIAPGYETFKTSEILSRKELINAKYFIKRHSYSDYEIVVYGKQEEKEVSRHQLTVQEVKRIPGLGGDALKVVQAMPGVGRAGWGGGDVIVRGAPTWDSKFYLEGVNLPQLYHFGGVKSVYTSDALETIDFYPGGFNTRYGNVTAGVIEVKGREAKNDRIHVSTDLNLLDGSFLLEGPIGKKTSALVSGRRSFIGEVFDGYMKARKIETFSALPTYWDYLARVDNTPSKNHHFFVTAFGSRDSLVISVPEMQGNNDSLDGAADKARSAIMFHTAIAGWDWKINSKLRNTLRYQYCNTYTMMTIFGYEKMIAKSHDNTFRDELTLQINKKLKINFGLDMTLSNNDIILSITNGENMVKRDTIKDWLFGDIGAYVNAEIKPIDKLTIIPGIRYDYYPELVYNGSIIPEFKNYKFDNDNGISGEPAFRLNARYALTESHTIKGAVGSYSQSPQPRGQVIHKDWGDPAMPATKASHCVLGYEWKITDLISSDLQAYQNFQWDLPREETQAEMSSNSKPYRSNGKSRSRGLELMLRHNQGPHFFGWIAYTLSRSERLNRNTNKYELYKEDITNNLQVIGSWKLRKNWETGFRARYTTGKPNTPIDSVGYDEKYKYYFPYYGKSNSTRLKPYFSVDYRVDKKFIMNKWVLSTYLDFQNISYFFYKSPETEFWDDFYKEKTTIAMIPIPAFGIKAEF